MPRKKVILHIGASKAGSSSIQTFLRRNRVAFAQLGHVIPDTALTTGGKVTGNHVFALEALVTAGDAATFRERIDGLFEQSAPDTQAVLFSAENLSNPGNSGIIDGLAEAYDLRIVMYLRRQDELLTAAWQQWGSKRESDFNAWLILALKQYGQWQQVLGEWERHAGREAMAVRVFERASFLDGDLLRDFVAAIGLAEHAAAFDYEQDESNQSISDAVTEMVAGNRRIFTDVYDNRLQDGLSALTGNALVEKTKLSLLTRGQREKIIEYYRPINEAVCRQFFPGRKRLFEPVDHGKFRYVTSDQMLDEKFGIIMTILAALVQERAR
jgi:hypothetical protein